MGVLDTAHDRDGAIAEPGTWVDSCARCREQLAAFPDVILLVRGGGSRALVRAADLHHVTSSPDGSPGPEHFLAPGDYVRDVSTATDEAQRATWAVHHCLGGCSAVSTPQPTSSPPARHLASCPRCWGKGYVRQFVGHGPYADPDGRVAVSCDGPGR